VPVIQVLPDHLENTMRHHPSVVWLAGVVVALGAFLVGTPAAQAAACSGTSGVTVVVQFPDWTEIGCAAGNPSSGFAALTSAGFSLTYAQGNGAGALCRIDGVPGSNPCTSMPPANAYWSYWHAKPGGSWGYASTGGGAYDPAPGSVEGWRFGDGKTAPSTKPPAVSSPKPTPKPSPKPSTKPSAKPAPEPTAKPTTATQAAAPTATASGTAAPTATATASASSAAPSPSASTSDDASSDPTADTTVAAAGTEDEAPGASDDSGGLSWVWGVALLAVVGTAGTVTYLRRRQG